MDKSTPHQQNTDPMRWKTKPNAPLGMGIGEETKQLMPVFLSSHLLNFSINVSLFDLKKGEINRAIMYIEQHIQRYKDHGYATKCIFKR